MPRNKRKHPHTRYERIMLAAINTLPFKFHSPGQPNIPKRPREVRPGVHTGTGYPSETGNMRSRTKLQRLQSSPGPKFKPTTKEHTMRQLSDRTASGGDFQRIRAAHPNKEAMN